MLWLSLPNSPHGLTQTFLLLTHYYTQKNYRAQQKSDATSGPITNQSVLELQLIIYLQQNALALNCNGCFLYLVEWREHPIIHSEVHVEGGFEILLACRVEEAGFPAVVGQFLFTVFWLAEDGRQLLLSRRVVEVDEVQFCLRRHVHGGHFCIIVLDHHPCRVLWVGEKAGGIEKCSFIKSIVLKILIRLEQKNPNILVSHLSCYSRRAGDL